VRGVDLVATVHVPSAEEAVRAAAQLFALVRGRVRPQQRLVVEVVRVAGRAAGVLRKDAEVVEALLRVDDGILRIEHDLIVGEAREVILDFRPNNSDGMIRLGVQSLSDQCGDVWGDVVVGMIREVARRVDVRRSPPPTLPRRRRGERWIWS